MLTKNDKMELVKLAANSTTQVKIRGDHALIGPEPIKYCNLSDIKKSGRL